MVILGHFLPFYHPQKPKNQNFEKWKNFLEISSFYTVYQKSQSYGVWFLRYGVRQIEFFVILDCFLHFTSPPLWIQKIKILKKMKKTSEDIIILQICTINDSHMMYGSWGTECNRQNVLPFWTFFALLPPWQSQKSKFWKNEKTTLRSYYFTQV